MDNPLISVVVPVYNTEKYLSRAIESIMRQTYENLEILIINDGSTDNSGHLCDEYAAKDDRIHVIHQENCGVSAARNTGLDAARGEWIGFVDSDDWIDPSMYEKLLNAAQGRGSKIVVCGHNDYRGSVVIKKGRRTLLGSIGQVKAIEHLLAYDCFEGYLWNKLFSRSLLTDICLDTDIHFCEDILFCTKVFMLTENIYCIPDTLYHHCLAEHSAMLNFNAKRLTELLAWERTASTLEQLSTNLAKIAKCRYADAAIAQYYYMGHASKDSALKHSLKKKSLRYFVPYVTSGVTPLSMRVKSVIKLMFPCLRKAFVYCRQKKFS